MIIGLFVMGSVGPSNVVATSACEPMVAFKSLPLDFACAHTEIAVISYQLALYLELLSINQIKMYNFLIYIYIKIY